MHLSSVLVILYCNYKLNSLLKLDGKPFEASLRRVKIDRSYDE